METMLITSALNELKLLNDRINRKIAEGEFVTFAKKKSISAKSNLSKEDFKADSKATLQSITSLIKRRNLIKSLINLSNATTKVNIAGVDYMVIEAIDRKNSIEYEKSLLAELKRQLAKNASKVDYENNLVNEGVERLLLTAYGKDSKEKLTKELHDAITLPYREANEYELVDGIGIANFIKTLECEIEEFLSNVDTALQVSNSTTLISIPN